MRAVFVEVIGAIRADDDLAHDLVPTATWIIQRDGLAVAAELVGFGTPGMDDRPGLNDLTVRRSSRGNDDSTALTSVQSLQPSV